MLQEAPQRHCRVWYHVKTASIARKWGGLQSRTTLLDLCAMFRSLVLYPQGHGKLRKVVRLPVHSRYLTGRHFLEETLESSNFCLSSREK